MIKKYSKHNYTNRLIDLIHNIEYKIWNLQGDIDSCFGQSCFWASNKKWWSMAKHLESRKAKLENYLYTNSN